MNVGRMVVAALALFPALAAGQTRNGTTSDWRFLTRVSISGSSHESSPAGYEIFSGVALEGALIRDLRGGLFGLELSLRTEAREVEGPASLPESRLGSLDMVPANLTLRWQPMGRTGQLFQPYAGAGVDITWVWEKSGLLDSTDPPVSVNPVGQLGSDLAVSSRFRLNLDVKWHPLDVELKGFATPTPNVEIDPLTLSAGFGFVF